MVDCTSVIIGCHKFVVSILLEIEFMHLPLASRLG